MLDSVHSFTVYTWNLKGFPHNYFCWTVQCDSQSPLFGRLFCSHLRVMIPDAGKCRDPKEGPLGLGFFLILESLDTKRTQNTKLLPSHAVGECPVEVLLYRRRPLQISTPSAPRHGFELQQTQSAYTPGPKHGWLPIIPHLLFMPLLKRSCCSLGTFWVSAVCLFRIIWPARYKR